MKKTLLSCLLCLAIFGVTAYNRAAPAKETTTKPQASSLLRKREMAAHNAWVMQSYMEMRKIRLGMTRAQLLKVFSTEGGLSTRTQRTYVYHDCPNIKVDVKFRPVGKIDRFWEGPQDVIVSISKPYLALTILD